MSFLKIGDRAAGAIKSGGTTRRAAKMVVVDVDHPDIEAIHRLEGEGGAEGRRARHRLQDRPEAPQGDHEGLRQLRRPGRRLLRSGEEPGAEARDQAPPRKALVPENYIQRVIQFARQGYTDDRLPDLRHRLGFARPTSPSPARTPTTRSRVTDDFLRAVETDGDWNLTAPHRRQGHEDAEGARPVGEDRLRRLGLAPIPACSSTPR